MGLPRLLLAATTLVVAFGLGGAVSAGAAAPAWPGLRAQLPVSAAQLPVSALQVVTVVDGASSFHTDYVVRPDGSVDVTEHLTWVFPPGEERHGIYRDITIRAGYQDRADTYRSYELSNVSVSSPSGAPTPVSVTEEGATARLKIGSATETVSGAHRYVVSYRLPHIVNDIGDGTAEFYFNHVGTGNAFETAGVSASVTGPAPAITAICYVGPHGSAEQCSASAGETSQFSSRDLGPFEGMSIVTSYPRAAFADLTVDLRSGAVEEPPGRFSTGTLTALTWSMALSGLLLPLVTGGYLGVMVFRRGRDARYAGIAPGLLPGRGQRAMTKVGGRKPPVTVRFTPPDGVPPGLVGVIMDQSADDIDVTATLVDLAVRGHLTITRVPDPSPDSALDPIRRRFADPKPDWTLTRTRPPASASPLLPYEKRLLDRVFSRGDSVNLSDLKDRFARTLEALKTQLDRAAVKRGWFARSPELMRETWVGAPLSVGILVSLALVLVGLFGIPWLLARGLPGWPLWVIAGGIGAALVLVLSLGPLMPARTARGSAIYDQARGFRRYLETAEAGQIRWEEAQDIFSRFLPYAMVFGLADRWAQVFEEVVDTAAAEGHSIGMPAWFGGDLAAGSVTSLTAAVGSFSSHVTSTFSSTPGSSGSSGSGGGGYSGGGGGGSSGGSW